MKKRYQLAGAGLSCALLAGTVLAQRPRMNDPAPAPIPAATQDNNKAAIVASDQAKTGSPVTAPPAVQTVKVKYQGGVFGYNQKMDGTLTFDHMNEQLVFRNKQQKEMFRIPYAMIMAAFADTQSHRPGAATVVGSAVPYGLGLPALLIKKKYRYMNLQYSDEDMRRTQMASFKFDNKETLNSTLQSVADESGLSQRGEVFIRKRTPPSDKGDN